MLTVDILEYMFTTLAHIMISGSHAVADQFFKSLNEAFLALSPVELFEIC